MLDSLKPHFKPNDVINLIPDDNTAGWINDFFGKYAPEFNPGDIVYYYEFDDEETKKCVVRSVNWQEIEWNENEFRFRLPDYDLFDLASRVDYHAISQDYLHKEPRLDPEKKHKCECNFCGTEFESTVTDDVHVNDPCPHCSRLNARVMEGCHE